MDGSIKTAILIAGARKAPAVKSGKRGGRFFLLWISILYFRGDDNYRFASHPDRWNGLNL
jgi:hypothetical protein